MHKYIIKDLLVYVLYNIILLTVAYFLDRFFQILIFILFFSFIQNCFYYRFHADTIIKDPIKAVKVCRLITITVEIVYMIFCKNLDISIYSNLLIIFLIAFTNCILQFSLENFITKQINLKDKDTLLLLCNKANLTKSATDRMILKYIDGKTYQEIADIECVDIDTIKKSINRSRKKIFENRD